MALAALREEKLQGQLASEFAIHPLPFRQAEGPEPAEGQVGPWKKQASEGLAGVFGRKPERDASEVEERERQLYDKIGRLQAELDWLKKARPCPWSNGAP